MRNMYDELVVAPHWAATKPSHRDCVSAIYRRTDPFGSDPSLTLMPTLSLRDALTLLSEHRLRYEVTLHLFNHQHSQSYTTDINMSLAGLLVLSSSSLYMRNIKELLIYQKSNPAPTFSSAYIHTSCSDTTTHSRASARLPDIPTRQNGFSLPRRPPGDY